MVQKKTLLIGVGAAAALAAGAVTYWPHAAKTAAPAVALVTHAHAAAAAKAQEAPAAAPLELSLADALQKNSIRAEFKANGKDKLTLAISNLNAQPIRLHIPAGQVFSSAKSAVALARSHELSLAPNESKHEELQTVATASTNALGDATYSISKTALPANLQALFARLDDHPEISIPAAQTAVLALSENLPLSAVAKFSQLNGAPAAATQSDTKNFKADTCDIIAALTVLRELGMDERLALAIEPQLKIEAMIDPLAHALALRYYNISDEWAYWKHELLQGDGSTRHYALYGIARFYPDVALQMLPTWAREARINPVYRMSAVQALAETQKPEALQILRQLEQEFGAQTDLGKAAHTAAGYLDAQFTKTVKVPVAFRTSKNLPQQEQQPAASAGSASLAAPAAAQTGSIAAAN